MILKTIHPGRLEHPLFLYGNIIMDAQTFQRTKAIAKAQLTRANIVIGVIVYCIYLA